MAQVTVSEAAKLVSRDRKTLYRLIKEGKISATVDETGKRQLETSELLRFFGAFTENSDKRDSRATVSMPQHETVHETPNATVRLAVLEAELRHAREMIAVKDEQIADLRQSVRLLAAPETEQSIWTRPIRLWPKK